MGVRVVGRPGGMRAGMALSVQLGALAAPLPLTVTSGLFTAVLLKVIAPVWPPLATGEKDTYT